MNDFSAFRFLLARRLRNRIRRAREKLREPKYLIGVILVVGYIGFILLTRIIAALVAATDIPPARFVLWLIAFYFLLVMAEAWMLARESAKEGTTR